MSERVAATSALVALHLGSRFDDLLGKDLFNGLLFLGWAVVIVWTVLAHRRGERVFIWQKHDG